MRGRLSVNSFLQLLNLWGFITFSKCICLKFFRSSFKWEEYEEKRGVWSWGEYLLLFSPWWFALIWTVFVLPNDLVWGIYFLVLNHDGEVEQIFPENTPLFTLNYIKACCMHNSVHLSLLFMATHSRWMWQPESY